jgi:glycosyltransferase involved in cell wall biosynthesis
MGAMAELVSDGRGGVRFAPGDAGELASRVIELHRDPQRTRDLRQQARREFVDRYTADANHRNLMIAYESAILTRGQEGRRLGARHGKSVLVDWAKTA